MRNLIQFFIRQSSFFVFLFYGIISVILLVRFNTYHQSVFFSSANEAVGEVYSLAGNVTSYFGLRDINQDLLERNGHLEKEIQVLKEMLQDDRNRQLSEQTQTKYDFIMAQVINNSVTQMENYITLNKGSKDGLAPQMGVVDQNGIIGIVSLVSENYAVVISLLNTKLRLSAKVKGSDYFGSLVWDAESAEYAILEELPRHVEFTEGDTIVTSGYSAAFPEGLPVGIIAGYSRQRNDNFYALKIRLSADFNRLNDVRVIINNQQQEQLELQERARK
ncbi:MAG: rod shape-determining protein MreC [Bacteroidales bacterium]